MLTILQLPFYGSFGHFIATIFVAMSYVDCFNCNNFNDQYNMLITLHCLYSECTMWTIFMANEAMLAIFMATIFQQCAPLSVFITIMLMTSIVC